MRILVCDPIAEEGLAILREHAEVLEEQLAKAPTEMDALIVRSRTILSAEVIERGRPRLKVVGRAGVGVDNIDLEAARRLGVIVVHAPQAPTQAVAEHALALMFALARQIPRADASMRRGEWRKGDLRGVELAGKRLGIIGMGRIGTVLSARAQALGMEILGHDALITPEEVAARGAQPVSLQRLLQESDFISLHVPLTPATRGLIGSQELKAIKPSARLVSTARGGVVDERALLAALEKGELAGAALDVFAQEPPGSRALIQHPKLISTPHIAAGTAEAQRRAGIDIAEETLAALRGDTLRWQVV